MRNLQPRVPRILVVLLVGLLLRTSGGAEPPADVQFEKDIVYGSASDTELKLNLSQPKDREKFPGPRPCVLVIHGGGWRAGDRSAHNDVTWKFAQRGYVSATVGYRFCPQYVFPAQVQDVKCAVRFLRANAEKYGIDPNRFGAVGFSAGAHLSMMLGAMDDSDGLNDSGGSPGQSSKVQAVVSFFGPTDLTADFPDASKNLVRDFIGGSKTEKLDAYRQASPITYVNPGDPPMLLFQGTNDPLVPYAQAIQMLDAMHKAGVPGRVELISGASHGWGGRELARTADATFSFFDQYLSSGATMAESKPDKDGFYSLFNGKNLDGWKVGKFAESWKVEDGQIVVHGPGPSHLFYVGPVHHHDFKNFHLKAQVMTFPHANSGIYFHTKYQEQDWPEQGFEAQVNATHSDWKKTGSLYDVKDIRDPHHEDNKWFLYEIIVKGDRVQLKVDGQTVCDWTQPPAFKPPAGHPGRFLHHGTFALQGHDPGSETHFKDIEVKPLDE